MIFFLCCVCPAGQVTEFCMQLSGLKWRVKNFTPGDIYVALGEYDELCNVRIAPGESEVLIDRDPRTGTRRTARLVQVHAEITGEVEVLYV